MNTNKNGTKVVVLILFFMGLMFFMPMIIISVIDGFSTFMLLPIIMFIVMAGIFLLILYVAKKNINKTTEFTKDGYQSEARHCIHCHEEISTSDTFCPDCGAEQTNYIVCDYCGHQNNKHNLQCEKCNALIK